MRRGDRPPDPSANMSHGSRRGTVDRAFSAGPPSPDARCIAGIRRSGSRNHRLRSAYRRRRLPPHRPPTGRQEWRAWNVATPARTRKGAGQGQRKREGGAGAGPPGASSDTGGGSTGSADPARGYAVGSAAGTPAAPGTPRSQSMHVSRGAAGGVSSAKGTAQASSCRAMASSRAISVVREAGNSGACTAAGPGIAPGPASGVGRVGLRTAPPCLRPCPAG